MIRIGIVILILMSLCSPSVSATEAAKSELLIGLIPEENIFKQMDRYRPLAKYLSEKLSVKIKLTILSRYGDIIDSFTTRNMDGAFFGVFTGVLAREKLGIEHLARPVNLDGTSSVQSYIFVRKDSGIKGVKDMKEKRVVFVDRATVTGYLFAVSFLREHGVRDIEHYFKEYYFSGSHDSAIFSVLDNRADIGIAKSRIFNALVEKDPLIRKELIIIAQSPHYPTMTLGVRKDLPQDLKTRMREVLLAMNNDAEGREVLKKFGAQRFVGASEKDLDSYFELAAKTGINLKTYKYK